MNASIEKLLVEIPNKEGYTYNELKDSMTEYELGILVGLASAIENLDNVVDEEFEDTGSDLLDIIMLELDETVIFNCKETLKVDIIETLLWIGDNHAEED